MNDFLSSVTDIQIERHSYVSPLTLRTNVRTEGAKNHVEPCLIVEVTSARNDAISCMTTQRWLVNM